MVLFTENLIIYTKERINLEGLIIGVTAFIIIGVFHPIVIKSEYYFGKKVWPIFLLAGIVLIAFAITIENIAVSSIISITGFSFLWSIHELFEQEERVRKGWFPKNPKKSNDTTIDEKNI